MNLARGKELGITRKVDAGTFRLTNPPSEWYEGPRLDGGTTRNGDEPGDAHEASTSLGASPDTGDASSPPLDLANWMSHLSHHLLDTPLHKVRLIGSHDAASYKLSSSKMGALPKWLRTVHSFTNGIATAPFTGIIIRWGEAQHVNIYEQLRLGVRYLDLRVVCESNGDGDTPNANTFHAEHGMAGPDYREILSDIRRFLDSHPNEVVLCDFNHFHRFTSKQQHFEFIDLCEHYLGEHVAPLALRRASESGQGTLTYRECLRSNTRCLIFHGGWDHVGVARKAVEAGCWGRSVKDLWSPWPMANSRRELTERFGKLDVDGKQARGFFVLQGVVTPTMSRVVSGLTLPNTWFRGRKLKNVDNVQGPYEQTVKNLSPRPKTLRQLAERVTPLVSELVVTGKVHAMCVVIVDHVDLADVRGMLLAAYPRR